MASKKEEMIKANELRIGNYVNAPKGSASITALGSGKLLAVEYGSAEYNELEPIPITPEILNKCGFKFWPEAVPEPYWKTKDGFPLYIRKGYFILRELKHTNMSKVIYLHQLQNLHFALTGEELEIKL